MIATAWQFIQDGVLFNNLIATFLYYVPLLCCVIGFFLMSIDKYRNDLNNRRNALQKLQEKPDAIAHYYPTLTIGCIIGAGLVSIIPVANIIASFVSTGPYLFGNFFKWIGRVFDQAIVPVPKELK
jgi:hypothetical protein